MSVLQEVDDGMGLRELSLFTGAGGGLLGGALLGWRTVCCVERDAYCQRVLVQRMRDGVLHDAPIWDDCATFDGRPWRGRVDVLTAGFPCQPLSIAGQRKGSADARDGWPHTARILGEVRPRWALVENSPAILTAESGSYFARLLSDVAALGYSARWCVLGAADVGAPHRRDRWWCLLTDADREPLRAEQVAERGGCGALEFGCDGLAGHVADADSCGWDERPGQEAAGAGSQPALVGGMANPHGPRQPQRAPRGHQERDRLIDGGQEVANPHGQRLQERELSRVACDAGQHPWGVDPAEQPGAAESGMGRVAHGVAHRVDQLRALGNGQVPLVAALAWAHLGGPVQ
jgi:DNA (cytosine-5)-methyltransferase 1